MRKSTAPAVVSIFAYGEGHDEVQAKAEDGPISPAPIEGCVKEVMRN